MRIESFENVLISLGGETLSVGHRNLDFSSGKQKMLSRMNYSIARLIHGSQNRSVNEIRTDIEIKIWVKQCCSRNNCNLQILDCDKDWGKTGSTLCSHDMTLQSFKSSYASAPSSKNLLYMDRIYTPRITKSPASKRCWCRHLLSSSQANPIRRHRYWHRSDWHL